MYATMKQHKLILGIETMIRIRPYKGKYCSRRVSNIFSDFYGSLRKPDRTELKTESAEFRRIILDRRAARANKTND